MTIKSGSAKTELIFGICAEIKDKLPATHVITEVKYGFNAFLLFETKKTKNSTKQDIGGSLSIVIKKIPGFDISGSGELKLTESQKNVANNLTFKFHGDTVIDPPPQTFEEAIKVYKSLPQHAKDNERVVSFSIAPLTEYCTEADSIVNSIADNNIKSVSEMMEDFEKVRKYLRKLKNSNLALDFQRYRAVLLDAEQRYEEQRSYYTSMLQQLLPKVRSDSKKQVCLTQLLTKYKTSRYERETFTGFLDTRQKEIETAEYIIYNPELPYSTYIDLDNTGDMAECIIGHDYALVYKLQILPGDPTALGVAYAKDCAQKISPDSVCDSDDDDDDDDGNDAPADKEDEECNMTYDESDKWFKNETEIGENRPLMDVFKKLALKNNEIKASICFLVKLNSIAMAATRSDGSGLSLQPADGTKRFQLSLLKAGESIMDDFEAPPKIQTQSDVKVVENSRKLMEVELSVGCVLKALTLKSASYSLRATYNQIDESVSWIL